MRFSLFCLLWVAIAGAVIIAAAVIAGIRGAFGAQPVDPERVASWLTPLGIIFAVAAFFLLPVFTYMWYRVLSSSYHEGEKRLWRMFRTGFRYWPRIVKLNLWALLFTLPLMALHFWTAFHDGFPTGAVAWEQGLASLQWRLLPTSLLFYIVAVYESFAALGVIWLELPALAAWKRAFRLISRKDWLTTVGLLAGLQLMIAQLSSLLSVSGVGRFLAGLATFLLGWYLAFCGVALWHRYNPEGVAGEANS